MEFRLLGLLGVGDRGREIELARGRERALLALLLLHANEPVSTDSLIEELWADAQPENAAKTLQVYVSRLRKSLGAERLKTTPAGYALEVAAGELDTEEFERLAAEGRAELAKGEVKKAERLLAAALALWRGPALADFRFESFAQSEIRRLEELQVAAQADRIDARLAGGRADGVVAELEQLVDENTLWERPRAQLMRALYASGRQTDALELYRATRKLLANEHGLEPSEELQALERAILNHDPALAAPTPAVRRAIARRGGRLLLAGGALVAAAAAAALAVLLLSGGDGIDVAANAVVVIDPRTNGIVAQVPVGGRPVAIVAGLGAIWVANRDDGTVLRIDPRTRKVVKTVGLGINVSDLAVGAGSIWVAGGNDSLVVRLSPRGEIQATIHLPVRPALGTNTVAAVTVGAGSVWAASVEGLSRIDDKTNTIERPIHIGSPPVAVFDAAATADAVWVVVRNNELVKILPQLDSPAATLRLGEFLNHITAGGGAIWVADDNAGTIWRVSTRSNRATGSIKVGGMTFDVAVGEGGVWSANPGDGTISRVDASADRLVTKIRLGWSPSVVAVGYGRVWVGVAATPPFPQSNPPREKLPGQATAK